MAFDEMMDSEQRFQFLLRESEAADNPENFAELIAAFVAARSEHASFQSVLDSQVGPVSDPEIASLTVELWAAGLMMPTPSVRRKMVAALHALPKPEVARP